MLISSLRFLLWIASAAIYVESSENRTHVVLMSSPSLGDPGDEAIPNAYDMRTTQCETILGWNREELRGVLADLSAYADGLCRSSVRPYGL